MGLMSHTESAIRARQKVLSVSVVFISRILPTVMSRCTRGLASGGRMARDMGLHRRSGWPISGHSQPFPVFRVLRRKSFPIYPGYGPGRGFAVRNRGAVRK